MSIRRDRFRINWSEGLSELKDDLRQMLRERHTLGGQALEIAADDLYQNAIMLVPLHGGLLADSIDVSVSRSGRYPGIIATASAWNRKGTFDYALIQHENEDYEHLPGRQAHYLSEPFEEAVKQYTEMMDDDS